MVQPSKKIFGSTFETKKSVDVLILLLVIGLLITTILSITSKAFKNMSNINLRDEYHSIDSSQEVYTTQFFKAMVYTILGINVIIFLLFFVRTISVFLSIYTTLIKILLVISLLSVTSFLIPSYTFISDVDMIDKSNTLKTKDNLTKDDLQLLSRYLISCIIISYILSFLALSSCIYDIKQKNTLFV